MDYRSVLSKLGQVVNTTANNDRQSVAVQRKATIYITWYIQE